MPAVRDWVNAHRLGETRSELLVLDEIEAPAPTPPLPPPPPCGKGAVPDQQQEDIKEEGVAPSSADAAAAGGPPSVTATTTLMPTLDARLEQLVLHLRAAQLGSSAPTHKPPSLQHYPTNRHGVLRPGSSSLPPPPSRSRKAGGPPAVLPADRGEHHRFPLRRGGGRGPPHGRQQQLRRGAWAWERDGGRRPRGAAGAGAGTHHGERLDAPGATVAALPPPLLLVDSRWRRGHRTRRGRTTSGTA